MVVKVKEVEAIEDYQLQVVFEDGTQGTIDLSDRLYGSMFEPLKDPELFSKVEVDEYGAITWPNGADLAPDAVYEKIKSKAA